jgi:SAM-dependent methyltransferase
MVKRSIERLRYHYEVEKELAARLLHAPEHTRASLYAPLYQELFARVPDHPQLQQLENSALRARKVQKEATLLERLLPAQATLVEIGAGDGATLRCLANHLHQGIGIEVTPDLMVASAHPLPSNITFRCTDDIALPVSDASTDLAYSHQLIEHLHPNDTIPHLEEVKRILKPGGIYLCCTSSRFSGPHDISKYFATKAEGFHLKEYSVSELIDLFAQAGYTNHQNYSWTKGLLLRLPIAFHRRFERLLDRLPSPLSKRFARIRLIQHLLEVRLCAQKPIEG